MTDILDKINIILEKYSDGEAEHFYKEDVVEIIDIIREHVKEDDVLLNITKNIILSNWNISNNALMRCVKELFSYYGIIELEGANRKMVLEKKGKFFIKKEVKLSKIDDINRILNK
jgi:hypothetical protein